MKVIVGNLPQLVDAVRASITTDSIVSPDTCDTIITEVQLKDIIKEFEFAANHRHPDAMAQVSPRVLVIALAHFKSLERALRHFCSDQ